jgi:cold shock CspA family protein
LLIITEVFTVKGKIARYMSFRGYGFIEVEGQERNVFFHMSNYPATFLPVQGQAVEFEMNQTPKGLEAVKIKIIKDEKEIVNTTDQVEESKDKKGKESDLDRLTGIGPMYKKLLEKSMVKSCADLAKYTPEVLLTNLLSINDEENVTKRPPTLSKVGDWVKQASELSQ